MSSSPSVWCYKCQCNFVCVQVPSLLLKTSINKSAGTFKIKVSNVTHALKLYAISLGTINMDTLKGNVAYTQVIDWNNLLPLHLQSCGTCEILPCISEKAALRDLVELGGTNLRSWDHHRVFSPRNHIVVASKRPRHGLHVSPCLCTSACACL